MRRSRPGCGCLAPAHQAAICQDTDLLVPLAPANQGLISDQLAALTAGAGADAALAEAMVAAIRDLAATAGPHSLVVVTGGADSCNPEAGQLIAREAAGRHQAGAVRGGLPGVRRGGGRHQGRGGPDQRRHLSRPPPMRTSCAAPWPPSRPMSIPGDH